MKKYKCPKCGKTNTDNWPLQIGDKIKMGGCQKCWENSPWPVGPQNEK